MTTSFNFHDCALKRLESDAMAAQVAEHLANGGTVTVVPGYAPKARPVSHLSKNVQRQQVSEQTNRNKILQAVRSGYDTDASISAATGLSRETVRRHLEHLKACHKVAMQHVKGNKRSWSAEHTA